MKDGSDALSSEINLGIIVAMDRIFHTSLNHRMPIISINGRV